jgi:hypothetical protein
MKPEGTLLLTGRDVAALLTIEECMAAVACAFKLYGEGKSEASWSAYHSRHSGVV